HANRAGTAAGDQEGDLAGAAANSVLEADLALDPVALEKFRTDLADFEAVTTRALTKAGDAVVQQFIERTNSNRTDGGQTDGSQSHDGAADPHVWDALAHHWTDYSIAYDYSSFHRVGPMKLDTFVSWYLRREVTLTQAQRRELPAFLRAWVSWCAEPASLGEPAKAKLFSLLDVLVPLP
ncbi:MAG: hypothetical protein M3021_04240, partial [Actinomycetota bacterium]|nr:hypothetical protein [Actinomycetota bacterium]